MLGSINKNTYVILALLMSVTMMIAMAGPATAAGCSNPTHQHFISFNSTQTMSPVVATTERIDLVADVGSVSIADKATDKFSSYNKSSPHHVLVDSGSGYLYKRSHSGTAHQSNPHVLAVAFKHRSPSGGWNDVTRQ